MSFDPSSYGATSFETPDAATELATQTDDLPLPDSPVGTPFESDEGDLAEQLLVVEDPQDEYR